MQRATVPNCRLRKPLPSRPTFERASHRRPNDLDTFRAGCLRAVDDHGPPGLRAWRPGRCGVASVSLYVFGNLGAFLSRGARIPIFTTADRAARAADQLDA